MPEYRRPRHRDVATLLASLDSEFLSEQHCYFGGGTRIALELDEYRESQDVDFLCADIAGYRALRSAVGERSLGPIARLGEALTCARDVRADQYGIRTAISIGDAVIKFEIILEARIALSGTRIAGLPVEALDRECCFAEKWLANADRWNDSAVLSRDLIDLAFMHAHWPDESARAGAEKACVPYGAAVRRAAVAACARFSEDASLRRHCVNALGIEDTKTMMLGLRRMQKSASRLPS